MSNIQTPKNFVNDVRHASHNLSLVKTSTIHPGFIYPIYSRKCLAGDKVKLDLNAIIKSDPLVEQLFSSFKLKIGVFFDSDSNYYGWLDNNDRRSVEDLINMRRHQLDFRSLSQTNSLDWPISISQNSTVVGTHITPANCGAAPHSLAEYAGIPVYGGPLGHTQSGSDDPTGRYFVNIDAGFWLTYLNIVRNYYVNNQEPNVPYCTGIFTTTSGSFTPFSSVPLAYIDNLFKLFRMQPNGVIITRSSDPLVTINDDGQGSSSGTSISWSDAKNSYAASWNWFKHFVTCWGPHGALFCDTHLPDEWTNLLSRDQGVVRSVVSTENNQFTIDTLRFQNKLQAWIDRLFVSGGRFRNWLRTVWGTSTSKDMDIPELIASCQTYLNPSPVMATATSDSVDLGQQGGSFNGSLGSRRVSFRASTPGRVMICVSLIPCVEYCQGLDPELADVNFNDGYNPEFSNLGFQDVPFMYYSVYPERVSNGVYGVGNSSPSTFFTRSVGKQVAWLHYMTDVNRCHGDFATDGPRAHWVLQRRFTVSEAGFPSSDSVATVDLIKIRSQLTQYINPLSYQYPFVSQTLLDPHWQFQLGIRGKWYRPVGKRTMPTLGR